MQMSVARALTATAAIVFLSSCASGGTPTSAPIPSARGNLAPLGVKTTTESPDARGARIPRHDDVTDLGAGLLDSPGLAPGGVANDGTVVGTASAICSGASSPALERRARLFSMTGRCARFYHFPATRSHSPMPSTIVAPSSADPEPIRRNAQRNGIPMVR